MGHVKKAFLDVGGERVIDRLVKVYRPLFPHIVIAAREPDGLQGLGTLSLDRFETRSSLTGIHAGLAGAAKLGATHAFVAACDTPFLQAGLVAALLAQVTPDDDVIIPLKGDGYWEPLCAVYSVRCIAPIEAQLQRGDFKVINFFGKVNMKEVPLTEIDAADPDHLSFRNINTPKELEEARLLAK